MHAYTHTHTHTQTKQHKCTPYKTHWKRVLMRGMPRSHESSKSSSVSRRFCACASCRFTANSAHTCLFQWVVGWLFFGLGLDEGGKGG